MTKESARDIWNTIVNTHEGKSYGYKINASKEFNNLKYEDGNNMRDHINKLLILSDRLTTLGQEVKEEDKVMQLLISLPDSWDTFKAIHFMQEGNIPWSTLVAGTIAEYERRFVTGTTVNNSSATPTVTDIETPVITDAAANFIERRIRDIESERRRSHRDSSGGRRVGYTTTPYDRGRHQPARCHYCRRRGHLEGDCYTKQREQRNREGRTSDRNDQINRSVTWHDNNGSANAIDLTGTTSNTSDEVVHLPNVTPGSPQVDQHWGLTTRCNGNMDTRAAHQWIIDSGCTNHMSFSKDLFKNLQPSSGSVSIADNSQLKIAGIGSVPLKVPIGYGTTPEVTRSLTIHNVFYVPGLRKNLLSVRQAQRRGTRFDFGSIHGRAVLSNGTDTLVSDSQNGLYVLNSINKVKFSSYTVITNPTSDTWHRRFGHANLPGI